MKRIILALSIISCGLNAASSADAAQIANPDMAQISVVLNLTKTTKWYISTAGQATSKFNVKEHQVVEIPLFTSRSQGTLNVDSLFGKKILDQDKNSVVVVEWPDSRSTKTLIPETICNTLLINDSSKDINIAELSNTLSRSLHNRHSSKNYYFCYLQKNDAVAMHGKSLTFRKDNPHATDICVIQNAGLGLYSLTN